MARKKLKRFADIEQLDNVIIASERKMAGHWGSFFGNGQPLTLELGCGKGEYTVALAEQFPDQNFIGLDKKGERIWVGAKQTEERGLENAAFVRGNSLYLDDDFAEDEVDAVWITFPGPFPKKNQANKRLTHPNNLARLKRLLAPGGTLHIKTDDPGLFEYSQVTIAEQFTVEEVCQNVDARSVDELTSLLAITTAFEQRHRAAGKTIFYLRARAV